jgi:hypothetical protein
VCNLDLIRADRGWASGVHLPILCNTSEEGGPSGVT